MAQRRLRTLAVCSCSALCPPPPSVNAHTDIHNTMSEQRAQRRTPTNEAQAAEQALTATLDLVQSNTGGKLLLACIGLVGSPMLKRGMYCQRNAKRQKLVSPDSSANTLACLGKLGQSDGRVGRVEGQQLAGAAVRKHKQSQKLSGRTPSRQATLLTWPACAEQWLHRCERAASPAQWQTLHVRATKTSARPRHGPHMNERTNPSMVLREVPTAHSRRRTRTVRARWSPAD